MSQVQGRCSDLDFLAGGGALGAAVRGHDWSASPLGPPWGWPQSLRSVVGLLLGSKFPMFLAWGPQLGLLYNDAYAEIFGGKHPAALGAPLRAVWPEIWADIAPLVDAALAGEATYHEDLRLVLDRSGFAEQAWFTFSYSPLRDESGAVAGMYCAVAETTDRVLGERRHALRLALEERLRGGVDARQIMDAAVEVLGRHLGASRVGYSEVRADGETIDCRSCFADGVAPLFGSFKLADFGPESIARQRRGATEAVADVQAENAQVQETWAGLDARAFASVPLVRDGALRASLYVNYRDPHAWSAEELALIEEVAVRTWSAVERAVAEAAEREQAARLKLALTAGQLAEVTFDLVGDRVSHSAGYAELLGHAPGSRLTLDAIRAQYHPDDRERVNAERAAILRSRQRHYEVEKRIVRPDGEVRWVYGRGQVARDADGRPHTVTVVYLDNTERKRAELALRESEARLALAADAAELGIWDWDIPSGRMTYSARAKAICGFAPDAAVTYEDARRVTHPDDLPLTSATARRALDPALRENAAYQYRIVRPDGTVRWVTAHGEAVFATTDGETRAVRYVGTLQDITERRRLEEADRSSQARLALAIGVGQMAVWEMDLATDQVTGSPELNRLLGFPVDATPTAEEMRAHYYPGERERLQAIGDAAVARGEQTIDAEYRYVWPDGSVRWLWLRAEGVPGADGRPARAIGVIMDVTERRKAEAALRASEARLKLAQQAAGIGVWDWDVASGAVEWSPEMYAILGLDPARDGADPFAAWLAVLHPSDRDAANAAAQQTAAGGDPFGMDFRIVLRGSGELRWVRSHGVAVLDEQGKPQRVVGINVDVTEERRRESRLRELASDLQSAVEASEKERNRIYFLSNDLFAVAGFDGFLKTINPAWERLLGYSEAELLARPFAAVIHPDDHGAAKTVLGVLRAGEALQRFEDRLVKANGEIAWISWAAVPEGDRFYAVGRDVTREREREEALRQSQKMEAMGQLTGGVAHDFNNLLTPIVGALDMLQRKGLGGEREQRLIGGAIQSADRAKTLVQRLLAFARRQPLQPVPVDVGRLVSGIGDLVASTTGPQIKVVVEVERDLPPAKADPNQLEMAVLNLAVNARDAMPDGGTLRISVHAATVGREHVSKLKPGRYLHLSVADTGSGMDDATLARAVEPFFSTKGVGKGTGLGLSMVHGLASQLGGALTIASAAGMGTNVELWLPQDEALPGSIEPTAGRPVVAGGRGSVLLVDDEDLVRLSTADMLTDLGYDVVEAGSAEEALQLLSRGATPSIVVTDHLMPGMSGTDFARRIQSERPSVKVLIVSGYAETAGVAPDLPRLTKPFRTDELALGLAALFHAPAG